MAAALPILTAPRDPGARRTLDLAPGTSILKAAQAASVDITATCGGRGRCTSCRVKFVAGAVPPPTIMDAVQLGPDLVREGYRLSCQCVPCDPVTVQVAPPLEELSFQILGAGAGPNALSRVALDPGIQKRLGKVAVPRGEHRQTSGLERLCAAVGVGRGDGGASVRRGLPGGLPGE